MSRISDTTTALEVTGNNQGGMNITGSQERSNRINGDAAGDLLLAAPLGSVNAGELGSADAIDGADGNDTIASLGGNDSVLGGGGNDLVFSNTSNDTVFGEQGQDTLLAGKGNDLVSGGSDSDVVYGDLGDDTLSGGDGNDIVLGGQGADSLAGDAGNDTLVGGDGNDILSGDRGADVMTGGVGNDTFAFSSSGNAGTTTETLGQDTITDFTSGSDKVSLGKSAFSAIGDTLETTEFETATQVNGASAAKVIYNSQTGELIYNPTTAVGDEVTIATLSGAPAINFGDFEVF